MNPSFKENGSYQASNHEIDFNNVVVEEIDDMSSRPSCQEHSYKIMKFLNCDDNQLSPSPARGQKSYEK